MALVLALEPVDKFLPVSVQLDAAQMEQSFRFAFQPAHTCTVEAFAHQLSHRPLCLPGGDYQILFLPFFVVHHVQSSADVVDRFLEYLSSPLGAWAMGRHLSQ